jgi:alcohol dehydrogenase YqhD (iron-dependent ADH family)
VKHRHLSRFVQFAVNVMGVENDFSHPDETAEKGIAALEDFYRKIGMPTNIHELLGREITYDEIDILVEKCSRGGTITLGAMEVIDQQAMREIYQMAK